MNKTKGNKNVAAMVEAWAAPIAAEHGLTVWDTEFKKEGADWVLRIYIDVDGRNISTEDCEVVSRAVEVILDREDPIEQAYMLEVSSPGLDRVLSRPEHFKKFIGHDVNVKLFSEIGGKKSFTGELKDFSNGTVTVCVDGEDISFEQKAAAIIKLDIIF